MVASTHVMPTFFNGLIKVFPARPVNDSQDHYGKVSMTKCVSKGTKTCQAKTKEYGKA